LRGHVEKLEYKITATKLLKAIKKFETYRQMSRQFDLPITVINRYAKGHVLPTVERAGKIIKIALPIYLKHIYEQFRHQDFKAIETDMNIVDILTDFIALRAIAGRRITTVIPVVPEATPMACLIASKIKCKLLIPRSYKRPGMNAIEVPIDYGEYITQTLFLLPNVIRVGRYKEEVLLVCCSLLRDRVAVEAFLNLFRKKKIGLSAVLAITAPPWDYDYPVIALFRAGR